MARHSQTNLTGSEPPSRLRHGDYTVAIICPMGDELSPVLALLDEAHENLGTDRDQNAYKLGKMGHHNVVVAGMPEIGNNAAAMVVTQLLNDFSQIRFALLVGVGGGIPDEDYEDDDLNDIRLGDVVVGHSRGAYGGVIQFDRGKATMEGFVVTGHPSKPPNVLAAHVEILKALHNLHGNSISRYLGEMLARYPGMREKYSFPGAERDRVFETSYTHEGGKTCNNCNISRTIEREPRRTEGPRIHYGTIGSSNTVIKDSQRRDKLRDMGILCVEMEAAGLMEAFPCLVIRGISDYADSHKNKKWQPYAAATAAAYSKELLLQIPQVEVQRTQSVTDALEGLTMKVDRVDQRTRILVGQTHSVAEMTILEWLSSKDVNFSNPQNESQQTHTAGTGQWLLEHGSYQNWRDREPGLLWLHGVAGCGKTILCSTIIQDLQQNFPHSAYWYFRFDSHISQDVSQMIRSIMRQLSSSPLPVETRSLYDRHGQRGSDPSLEELITALSCTIDLLARDVYIVLDALDECPHKDKKGQRDRLLHCIKILRRTHPSLHLLVTSRPETDIERDIRSVSSCDLDIEQPIRSDVETFVKVTLEDCRLASWQKDVRDQIIEKLLEYEERRFRWADLQIKRFAQCPNIEQLRKAMDSVPKDLEEAYRQAFDAIDDENAAHVAKIMMWLAVALEPLAADQIAAIAGFRDSDYVLQICSTLLVTIIDEDTSRIIKLAHFSVKEFLVLKLYEDSPQWYRFTAEQANKSIALFALRGLIHQDHVYQDRQLKKIVPYTAQYWPRHAIEGLKIDNQNELEEQICLFFSDEYRGPFLGWLSIHDPDYTSDYQRNQAAAPLYYASLLGFQSIVSKIWVNEAQLLRSEGRCGNALNAAAIHGNVTVVQWILRNCENPAGILDLVRVAGEINANVTECMFEICKGLADVVITEDVLRAAAMNEGSGQQVMKALLENRGDEVRITENIVIAAAGNRDSGQQVIELLLEQTRDEIQITKEVVKAAFANRYSGQHVLKAILKNMGAGTRITENMMMTAMENDESGQQVMALLLGVREKKNENQSLEVIASPIIGNFGAVAVNPSEKREDKIPSGEMVIKAAEESHLYSPQMTEMLQAVRDCNVQLTEGVVVAAAKNTTSGQQVLEVLLRKASLKPPFTSSVTCIIAERFDAHIMELLLEKNLDDIQLTEELLRGAASNVDSGHRVLEVLLRKKREKVNHITEQMVRAAARNYRCGQRVMEILISERADTVQITDKVFMLVACHWNGAYLMRLLSESIEDDATERILANAKDMGYMAAVDALQSRLNRLDARFDFAVAHGNTKAAELLIEESSRHVHRAGRFYLRRAAARGLSGIVELLLRYGVEQTASDTEGSTPLMLASEHGCTSIVDLLLTHGADLWMKDKRGRTALHIASMSGCLPIVNTLLQNGANDTIRDNRGWTPLMFASARGSFDIVDLLLTHEADPTIANHKRDRAIDMAVYHGHLEVVDMFLGRGADAQAVDKYGKRVLHKASFNDNIKNEHLELTRLFTENGADLVLLNGDGYTTLQSASYLGNIRMVELLLRSGANPAATGMDGITALHCASVKGHSEVVKILIEHGATIGFAYKFGCTPLHAASWEGHTEVVEILSSMDSCDLHLRDVFGYTALEVAIGLGHKEIVTLLENKSTAATCVTETLLNHEIEVSPVA